MITLDQIQPIYKKLYRDLYCELKDSPTLTECRKNGDNNLGGQYVIDTNFKLSIILLMINNNSLRFSVGLKINKILKNYLTKQFGHNLSINYFIKNKNAGNLLPIPNDLDDTVCAIMALYSYNPQVIHPKVIAFLIKNLTDNELGPGGPYSTWIRNPNSDHKFFGFDQDYDLAVNINIARCLTLFGIKHEQLNRYISNRVYKRELKSNYYNSLIHVYYLLSRYQLLEAKPILNQLLINWYKQNYQSAPLMDKFLFISSLIRLKSKQQLAFECLSKLISKADQAGWCPFWIDKIDYDGYWQAGSKALTIASIIEVLDLYRASQYKIDDNERLKTSLIKTFSKSISNEIKCPEQKFQSALIAEIQKLSSSTRSKEIFLLPFSFSNLELQTHCWEQHYETLVKISIAGWICYTIVDDIIDENKSRSKLTTALWFMRYLDSKVRTLPIRLQKIFYCLLALLESGMLKNKICLLTDSKAILVKNLFIKSAPHCFGIIAAYYLTHRSQRTDLKNIYQFCQHFLAARQLMDDLTDLEIDLKNNNSTPITQSYKYFARGLSYSDQSNLKAKLIKLGLRKTKSIIAKAYKILSREQDLNEQNLYELLNELRTNSQKGLLVIRLNQELSKLY